MAMVGSRQRWVRPLDSLAAIVSVLFCGAADTADTAAQSEAFVPQSFPASEFFALTAKDSEDSDFPFERLRGSAAVLITNVASKAPETADEYHEFIKLSKAKKMEGLHILAFPSNQFGDMEHLMNPSIREAAEGYAAFGLRINEEKSRFKLMSRVNVNGNYTHPVYAFMKKYGGDKNIEWNYATKFVVQCDAENCKVSRHDKKVECKYETNHRIKSVEQLQRHTSVLQEMVAADDNHYLRCKTMKKGDMTSSQALKLAKPPLLGKKKAPGGEL